MAFNDLESNQMVSFTDAQTSGFSLNSGQSHVTSNQCMTKAEALAKYNLSTSLMTSYASNQLVPKAVWGSSGITIYSFVMGPYVAGGPGLIESTQIALACSGANTGNTFYSTDSVLIVGSPLDSSPNMDSSLSTESTFYYKYGSSVIEINGNTFPQTIAAITACSTPPSYYTHSFSIVNSTSSSSACSFSHGQTLYTGDINLTIGDTVYLDSTLTNPINGLSRWWHSGPNAYLIDSSGGIISLETCN